MSSSQPLRSTSSQQRIVNLYKLKYRVVYCTGEDSEYPVTELLDNSPQSRGWQSAKFCEYPQEIILQFTNIVKLKQIQFLSHQSKITSRIELYTFVPTGQQALSQQIPLNQIEFKKLGFLGLDNNERSQFQARELKSVYVDQVTLLLKIVLQKCFVNKFNLYNQVGLIAVNCMGEMHNPIIAPPLQTRGAVQQQLDTTYTANSLEDELNLDPSTLDTLKELSLLKDQAVHREDFDEAKRLKVAIDRVRAVSGQLGALEERKRMAIVSEDYDAAKMIKVEIDRIKKSAMNVGDTLPPVVNQQHQQQRPSSISSQTMKPAFNSRVSMGHAPRNNIFEERKGMDSQQEEVFHYQNSKTLNANNTSMLMEEKKQQNMHDEIVVGATNQAPVSMGRQKQPQPPMVGAGGLGRSHVMSHDEQVIPTLIRKEGGGGNTGRDKYQEGDFGPDAYPEDAPAKNLQLDVSPNLLKYAEPLIPLLGEDLVKKVFSQHWPTRDEGLKECEEFAKRELSSGQSENQQAVFQGAMQVAGHAMDDKIAQVNQRGMSLLQESLKLGESLSLEPGSQSQGLIYNALLNKLGDNNQRVREKAEEILIQMATGGCFGAEKTISQVIRSTQQKKQQQQQLSLRHLVGRHQVLHKILNQLYTQHMNTSVKHGASSSHSASYIQSCFDYGLAGYKHQNNEVRQQAYQIIQEVYKVVGAGKMKQMLSTHSGLRQAQLDMLQEGFNQITPSIIEGSPKTGNNGNATKSPSKRPNTALSQQQAKCQFCFRADPAFANGETMDLHFWKDCPMLTECRQCNQVIEIETVNFHLLNECDKKDHFKECPRCKESIHRDDFDRHTTEKQCQISKPLKAAGRCPLCHSDVVPAGEEGWRRHLLEEGCPENPRGKQ